MEQPSSSYRTRCYIEFRLNDEKRFDIFARFFNALKAWSRERVLMNSQTHAPVNADSTIANAATVKARSYQNEEDWLLAFRPQDLDYLGMPLHRDAILKLKAWRDMSRKERREDLQQHPNLSRLADFADMVRQFSRIDYELVVCHKVENDAARVEYVTLTYPYDGDGKAVLEELLLFFGFPSIISESC